MRRVVIALVAALAAAAANAADTKLEESVNAAIDRIDASLKKTEEAKLDAEIAEMLKPFSDRLARARSATSPLLKLYRLREAYIGAESLAFVAAHRAAANDLEAFRTFWREQRPRFDKSVTAKRGPFLQTALRQAANNRAQKLFHASLPYGKVSSPLSGLYYLAEAEGNLRFRDFVDSLSFGDADRVAPPSKELEAAYRSLEEQTLKFFAIDPVSRAAIPVSARLKEARELIDQKTNEGATLALLETRLTLSRQQASKDDAPAASQVPAPDTLLALWQDMASEEQPDVARYIRRDVIPLYTSIVRSGS